MAALQATVYLTSQLSATPSPAEMQTWPKFSQCLSHRPSNGAVCTSAVHASQVTPPSRFGHAAKLLQQALPDSAPSSARCSCDLRCSIAGGARNMASQVSDAPSMPQFAAAAAPEAAASAMARRPRALMADDVATGQAVPPSGAYARQVGRARAAPSVV